MSDSQGPAPASTSIGDRDLVFEVAPDVDAEHAERARTLLASWRLPEGRGPIGIGCLAGGANNINFVVTRNGMRYVLKMRSAHGAKLTTGLTAAVNAQEQAAAVGAAPRVLASNPGGDFLSEFLVGTTLRPEVLRTTDCLPQIAQVLKTIHQLPPLERRFDIFEDVRVFTAEVCGLGGRMPDYFESLQRVAARFHAALEQSGAPTSFLHGDLVPQNMLLTSEGVRLVDFDYCGTGMTAADLAIVAAQAELNSEQTERLLRLYDSGIDAGQRARILGIQFINTLREISWACAAERKVAESTTLFGDWSYEYHARINHELAQRILSVHSVDELERDMRTVRPGALF
ncbi:MAG: phosphotransferase [Proteobacteria bacterium]|nr:phosphotransferase [Pseudomonadota bacterium]